MRRGDWGYLHLTCMNSTVFVNQFIYLFQMWINWGHLHLTCMNSTVFVNQFIYLFQMWINWGHLHVTCMNSTVSVITGIMQYALKRSIVPQITLFGKHVQ